jgi:hypothetical protein
MNLRLPGTCLNPTDEDRRVSERIVALERALRDTDTLWVDPRRCSAIVLLQDHAQHIGEVVDGCQRSLTTMYSVMLPHNSPPKSFMQLLDAFRSSQRIHRLMPNNISAQNISTNPTYQTHYKIATELS